MGHVAGPVAPVGRLLLLHWRGRQGTAHLHRHDAAGRALRRWYSTWSWVSWGKALPRDPKIWLAFFGMGLFNNVIPQSLIVWGETADLERPCLHPECHHAAVWGASLHISSPAMKG